MRLESWQDLLNADGPTRAEAAEIVARLESGETPRAIANDHEIGATGILYALGVEALGENRDESGPSLTRSVPKRPGLAKALSESAIAAITPGASRPGRLALRAGLSLIHDFWDESHDAAQQGDDLGDRSLSAFWHGIAHRREPDAVNAAYWFRRLGKHPAFGPLADAASSILKAEDALAAQLMPRGVWDPFAFIELCDTRDPRNAALARRIQRAEMAILLELTIHAAIAT